MSIEEFIPSLESSEGQGNSVESGSLEVSEKYKESSKKTQQGIQKTQKDEKKAKKYDFILAGFLVKIIVDKKYDFILTQLFKTTDYGYTSNFVLGILSLINIDISNKIRQHTKKHEIIFNYNNTNSIKFDDSNLPKEIKTRINEWIEDIIDSVIIDYSSIQTERIIKNLDNDNLVINNYIIDILVFFLNSVNIIINKTEARGISDFIISELLKKIKKLEIEEI